jgi:T3SS negative regulator,GrlR
MVEGFYIVQYEGMAGNGGGVAVFVKGRIFGGDTGYTYVGDYKVSDTVVSAHVSVKNFLAGVPSVLGIAGDFELDIVGSIEGPVIKATGRLPKEKHAVGIALKLTKRADLPA